MVLEEQMQRLRGQAASRGEGDSKPCGATTCPSLHAPHHTFTSSLPAHSAHLQARQHPVAPIVRGRLCDCLPLNVKVHPAQLVEIDHRLVVRQLHAGWNGIGDWMREQGLAVSAQLVEVDHRLVVRQLQGQDGRKRSCTAFLPQT